jgi:hypothetical protein
MSLQGAFWHIQFSGDQNVLAICSFDSVRFWQFDRIVAEQRANPVDFAFSPVLATTCAIVLDDRSLIVFDYAADQSNTYRLDVVSCMFYSNAGCTH